MQWETKKVLVTIKAYPEYSRKHGEIVCVAGITDEGDFIRLYPVPFEYFRCRKKIPKYSWIEVQCQRAGKEMLQRKESYKIRKEFGINIIDDSLLRKDGHTPWEERGKVILPLVSPSLEDLEKKFKIDKTSLGLIKPYELIDFYSTTPLNEIDKERSKLIQKTLFNEDRTVLDRIPHIFYYKFRCSQSCLKIHNISIEDWEIFQSFREWSNRYKTPELLWEKIRQRYYNDFIKKDLHFFMGTDSRWGSWMIIGAYYPPKKSEIKDDDVKRKISLDDFN